MIHQPHPHATLMHGDSLAILPHIEESLADMILTDPPYSSGGMVRGDRAVDPRFKYGCDKSRDEEKQSHASFGGDCRDQRSFLQWCTLWLSQCLRIAKPGAVICVFADWRQAPVMSDALQCGGWVWRGMLPWDKTERATRPHIGRFRAQCEYVLWGSAGPMPKATAGVDACHPGLFRHASQRGEERRHMTGKPAELAAELLAICPPGGLVLDPFAGSCFTAIGALRTGRRALVIEQSRAYIDVGAEWIRSEFPTAGFEAAQ